MPCGKTIGSLNAFARFTALSDTSSQATPTTEWFPLAGMTVRGWLNVLDEGGEGVSVNLAVQYAQVVTDQPSANGGRGDWAGVGASVTTEGIHAYGDIALNTQNQWVRFGHESRAGTNLGFGQADISAMFQIKPCGKVVGDINVAGLEADTTREIPISDWFVGIDTTNVRIGYLLDADANFKIDWYIQTANDTNRPGQPVAIAGQTQVSGAGAGTYASGNTGDLSISAQTDPATATDTPAYARIMARISTAAAVPVTADQLVVNVQVF